MVASYQSSKGIETMKTQLSALSLAIALAGGLHSHTALAESSLTDAISNADTKLNLRYRMEGVDQDGFDDDALASTLKTRLTWNTADYNGFTMLLEFDNVSTVGPDDYNSTVNGNTAYPVVADPTGTEVNQAFLAYRTGGLQVNAGRQRINHANQRFVGGVGWRQNEQTYDAVRAMYNSGAFSVDYSYVYNVNRIFGPEGPSADLGGDLHLLIGTYKLSDHHQLSAFNYNLDFEDAVANSTNTIGAGYTGTFGDLKIDASYARQSDEGSNPISFTADYFHVGGLYQLGAFKIGAGFEHLGSDNGVGFRTPLATLHKFQGWTDKFLGTPADGIDDAYVSVNTMLGNVNVTAAYHDFNAADSDRHLGSEIDLSAGYKVNDHLSLLAKYAMYDSDEHASDTSKFWLQAVVNF